MKTEEMKRFARDLRRHAGVASLKLSDAQAMTARIHGRRDWHHLEKEGSSGLAREESFEILKVELARAGSISDPQKIADALLPLKTFSELPENERYRHIMWDSDVLFDHPRHHEYAERLKSLPAGGVMILNGDWAMDPAHSNKIICSAEGWRNLDVRPITGTARSVAWIVKHEASGSFREDANAKEAIKSAIEAIGDGSNTVITVQNMERQIARKGKRSKEVVAALVHIAAKTGARLVFVIDDEHTDRAQAEESLKGMETLHGIHVESFDFAHYEANDPAFGEYVNKVAASLPMPALTIEGEDLISFHAMTKGMVENIERFFTIGMDSLSYEGKRIEIMNRQALAFCAQARREQMGDYIDIDHNPFTGEPWKDQGEEKRRRLRHERQEKMKQQGDPLEGLVGMERAIRYEAMEDQGYGSQLKLAADHQRNPISVADIMKAPIAFSLGHFSEGERWWTVVDGIAFKLMISANKNDRWSISIGTPGMKSRYVDGSFRFDRANYEGWINIHGDVPVNSEKGQSLRYQTAEDAVKSVSVHVVAAVDPQFPEMETARKKLLGRALKIAMEASGSVNGYIGLEFGIEPLSVGLTAKQNSPEWNEAIEVLRQELVLAFPDAKGCWKEGSSLRGGSIHATNRTGARKNKETIKRHLSRLDAPVPLKDAILALTCASLEPADQAIHLQFAN